MARRIKLVWTAPALDDLDEIAAWIALENPTAAARLVRRVLAAVERLPRHPKSGRLVPEVPGKLYREVIEPPCRVVYRVERNEALIIHVVRTERLLRTERLHENG